MIRENKEVAEIVKELHTSYDDEKAQKIEDYIVKLERENFGLRTTTNNLKKYKSKHYI